MFKSGEILIVTGSPGSGKTTAAKMLAERADSPKVHLHSDDFWHFIKAGAIAPWQPEAHSQNETVINVLAGAAAGYAQGGYFVIVDGIVGPWFLDAFRKTGCDIHYIVLQPDLDEAIKRCRARGGDSLADPVQIAALHDQFSELGQLHDHALSVVGMNVDATCEALSKAVSSGDFRLQ